MLQRRWYLFGLYIIVTFFLNYSCILNKTFHLGYNYKQITPAVLNKYFYFCFERGLFESLKAINA